MKNGDVFYDERNGRYLTVDGFGCDPKVAAWVVEEMGDDGEYEITGRQLFNVNELKRMKEV